MVPQAPWSPTAHAFAYHQFSHVANFWKQGRQASFQLDALPGGQAKLNLSFQLPLASEVVPPPAHVSPAHATQRPPQPLFPQGCFPKKADADSKQASKVSSRRRKSYRRSVLHRAALAAPTLPPPENGSLRLAAQACVQRLQAVSALSVSTPSGNKRPFPDSPSPSPSNHPSLSQRIRKDIQIGESEVESPEKEILRCQPIPENSPAHFSPCLKEIPSPVPLAPEKLSCVNCDAEFNLDHQCEVIESDSSCEDVQCGEISSPKETDRAERLLCLQNLVKLRQSRPPPKTVKCHVCVCLGRETSLVAIGSRCRSCGITASDQYH